MNITDRDFLLVAVAVYGFAFLFGTKVLTQRRPYSRAVMFTLLCLGFLVHTIGLYLRSIAIKACPLGNPFEIAQFIAWSLVLIFFIIGPAFRLRVLGFFTAGLSTLITGGSFILPSWDKPYISDSLSSNPWIELHAALAVFSYSVFAVLSLISFMFLIQQYGLKNKQFQGVFQILPSVQILDFMAKYLLSSGLILLTASLVFGAIFWAPNLDSVPIFKLTTTCLIWLSYLIVFFLRIQRRLVNKKYAFTNIILFLLAMLSLWSIESARGEKSTKEKTISTAF